MFIRVVTDVTLVTPLAGGEKPDSNPSRRSSRRKGCWKGWERLGKAKMFSRRGEREHLSRSQLSHSPPLSGLHALGRLGRLGTALGTARKLTKLNVYRVWDGGTASTRGVYIPRLRRVGVRRRRILTKPEQTRPIPTNPQEKSDPSLPSPSSSIIRYPASVMTNVMPIRSFPTLSAPFRTFPNLKIFCVVPWPPTFEKNPNLRESSRTYGNLSEP